MKEFIDQLANHGISVTEKQLDQFEKYFNILVEWNEKMNLTAIVEKEEVYEKHFYDSLTMAFDFKISNQHLCDVGSGAGFPSIPLKIMFPDLKITIIEALNKRVKFLKNLVTELELKDVEVLHLRAEQALEQGLQFDIVTARAVARLNVLSELCVPLVKNNGYFIVSKGQNAQEEFDQAQNAFKVLGVQLDQVFEIKLYHEQSFRKIFYLNKTKNTPTKYPRAFGVIKKNPL